MVEAASSFRKNGFNDDDAAQLAQISSMFQNVADETISAGDSADFIISQLIAFNQTSEDVAANATHIVDAINETSNSFAVSSGDLAQGLSVVASSSSAMGNSLEETIGLMVSITEQTRSASKASRGLNTIMANLAQVLDDSSSNGEKIKQIYSELGLSMEDSNGQLKSGYELLTDLAGKWNTLDGNTQKYIATTLAGTTQLNNFLALMNNFDHAIEATNTAINSQGSALKENERAIDSIQGKQQALNATFEEFANNIIDNELVKNVLGLANGFLQLANTDLGQFVTQVLLLTGVGWGTTSLAHAIKIVPIISGQFKTLGTIIGMISTQGGLMNNVLAAGSLALGSFSSVALPVIGVLAALGIGIYALYNHIKGTNTSLEEATSQLESVNTQLQTNRERLTEINSLEWNELTPEILAEKDALQKENEELRRNVELLEQRRVKAAKKQARTSGMVSTGETGYSATYHGEQIAGFTGQGFDTYEQLVQYLENYIPGASKKTRAELEELRVEFGNIDRQVSATAEEYNQHLITSLREYSRQLQSTHEINKEQVADFEELKSETAARVDGLKALQSEGEELTSSELALIAAYDRLIKAQDYAIQYSEKMISTAAQNAIAIYNEGIEAGKTKQEILDLAASNAIFNNAKLSVDEKIEALSRLAAQAGLTGFTLKSLSSAFQRDIDEMGEEAALAAYWSDITKMANAYTKKSTTNLSSKTGTDNTTKLTDKALEEFKTLQGQIKHQLEMGEIDETEYYNKLEQLVKEYKEKAIAHMKEYGLTVDKINENMYSYEEDIYKKRIELQQKAAEEAEKAWKESLEQQKSDMETAVSYLLKKIDDEISALEDAKTVINKKYDDEIQKIQDTNDELEEQIEYEEKLNQLAKAQQQQIYVFKNGQFQYMQDVDEVASAQAELDAYERERVMQAEVDSLEAKRDAEIAAIDDQIEYWNKYKEEWSGVVDQYTEEQNRLLAEQELGIDFEKEHWETRLENAQNFADRYNSIMASLDAGYSGISGTTTAGGDGYSFSGSGSSGWSEAEMAEGFNTSSSGGKSKSSINVSKLRSEAESALEKSKATGTAISLGGGVSIDYSKVKNKNAAGTLSSSGGLSLVGEQGPELRVLNSGDGVIPADITRNLWDWGKVNPKSMMSTMSQIFNIDNLTLPNARDAASLITGLKQMAYQRAYKRA